ncbi:hypothetical protein N7536_012275 [Penicillium majusculum]|nr:hypothetical protein N7536_012275 [Penicillium majusculum]
MSSASGTVTENGEIYQAQGDVQTAFEIPHGLPAAGFSSIPTLEAEQTSASRNDSMKNGTVEDGSESQERPPVSDVTKHLPMLDWALYITPPDDPKRPKIIYVIGSICMIDFARSPSTQSLAKALTYLYLATRIEPENPKYRGQYALALALRYNMTERITDLDLVITELETATATTNKWPGRFWKLKFLAETYKWRHHLTGNSEDLRKYSDIMEDLYNTTPDQFPDRAMISSQRENFKTFGIDDLAIGARFDMAVGITEDAFSRTARGERTYGEILRTLSDQYLHRWGQTGSSEDLNLVISAAELQHSHALEGDMPIGGATAGVVLAFYLRMRWDRHRCHGDLTRALQLMKEASDGALPGSSFQITCIILRASLLSEWPDGADQVQVLRASIEDIESAIAGSIDRISTYWKKDMLGLLSQQYKDLYRCTKDLTDLEKAIELIENYHDLGEEIGQQKEPSLGELGRLLIEKASCTGDNAAYRHGLRCLKQCCLSDLTLPDDRVKSARLLVHKAVHGEGWELACQIAEVIFPVMSLISSRDLSHDDKIHNLRSVSSLTSDACAAFLTLGFSNSALEKIELGQGILIGDMIDLQGKLHDLEQAHPELAQEYDGLRREASRSIESNRSEGRGKQSINNRRATFQRLQQCENRIREKPCFEAFLRPLTAPEMAGISYEGPIIVVNTTCVIAHALILTSSEIGNLRLESMVSHAAPQFRQHLARCAMEPGARDLESDLPSEAEDKELLSWLWYTCVKPVLEMLTSHGDISIGEEKSRVWWMGVGAASGLPFHAAGDYSNGTIDENENCLDLRREAEAILSKVDETLHVKELTNPSADDVLAELQNYELVHFACHGYSDPGDPAESHLLLQKHSDSGPVVDKLTVSKLLDCQAMSGSWIAYLSACSTAEIRDMNLRDEALHITSGFLIAGFSHVIGSLWPAEDDVCVHMAAYFYEALVARRATATDSNRAVAEAVLDATLRIRRQYCHSPLSWALYTHVGA